MAGRQQDSSLLRGLGRTRAVARGRAPRGLATQSQIGDQLQVAVVLGAGQVVEQSAAAADHLEQSAAGVVVVLVAAQMFGHAIDALGEQRDLDIGRAGVAGVEPVLLNDTARSASARAIGSVLLLDGRAHIVGHDRPLPIRRGPVGFFKILFLTAGSIPVDWQHSAKPPRGSRPGPCHVAWSLPPVPPAAVHCAGHRTHGLAARRTLDTAHRATGSARRTLRGAPKPRALPPGGTLAQRTVATGSPPGGRLRSTPARGSPGGRLRSAP